MSRTAERISSKDNPLLKELRRVAQDPGGYRRSGRIWIEGDHLCRAARDRGLRPPVAVFAEDAWDSLRHEWMDVAERIVLLPQELLAGISSLESPAPMGFVLDLPERPALLPTAASVILDRVQDAGNVGTMLRTAAASGCGAVYLLRGCAGVWSPKVLRSAMGAHFVIPVFEDPPWEQVLNIVPRPIYATHMQADTVLYELDLKEPVTWIFGNEGQGISDALVAKCSALVRIPQADGVESLNVAASAAICLYEGVRQSQFSKTLS